MLRLRYRYSRCRPMAISPDNRSSTCRSRSSYVCAAGATHQTDPATIAHMHVRDEPHLAPRSFKRLNNEWHMRATKRAPVMATAGVLFPYLLIDTPGVLDAVGARQGLAQPRDEVLRRVLLDVRRNLVRRERLVLPGQARERQSVNGRGGPLRHLRAKSEERGPAAPINMHRTPRPGQ
jgi:hypothetical protein